MNLQLGFVGGCGWRSGSWKGFRRNEIVGYTPSGAIRTRVGVVETVGRIRQSLEETTSCFKPEPQPMQHNCILVTKVSLDLDLVSHTQPSTRTSCWREWTIGRRAGLRENKQGKFARCLSQSHEAFFRHRDSELADVPTPESARLVSVLLLGSNPASSRRGRAEDPEVRYSGTERERSGCRYRQREKGAARVDEKASLRSNKGEKGGAKTCARGLQ